MAGGGHYLSAIPADAYFDFVASPEEGFYNVLPDADSPIGLRKVSPVQLANASWAFLRELVTFWAARAHDNKTVMPRNLQEAAFANVNDALGDGPVPLRAALDQRSFRFYVDGQSNEVIWEATGRDGPFGNITESLVASTQRVPEAINIWLSAGGTRSNLHYDSNDNWLCQLLGRKSVNLYAKEDSRRLYPVIFDREGDDVFYQRQLRPNGELEEILVPKERRDGKVYAGLIEHAPDHQRFPLFKEARPKACRVGPGECLWIPHHWWHNIRSEEGEINLSLNYWFGTLASDWGPWTLAEAEYNALLAASMDNLRRMAAAAKIATGHEL
mmetsp:Transcript_86648/g.193866  ORF Transcript_86648/g.193866 Transcript_86648/m.193866 type:complete len:328 (+) Transcript_86648:3-986(+)